MIVLDASGAVDYLLGIVPGAMRDGERIARSGETLHAPHLFDIEVLHAIRAHVLRGEISPENAALALADLAELRVFRYPHPPLLARAWELYRTVSAYDGAYIALAEVLGAPLVTLDRRLANATGHGARIEFLG